jgi:flagellar protein FlaJ
MKEKHKDKSPHPLISSPIRESVQESAPSPLRNLLQYISSYFPELKTKLQQANLPYDNTKFISLALQGATVATILILFGLFIAFNSLNVSIIFLLPLAPIFLVLSFFYFMFYPDVKIMQRERAIDQELVFACRHMLIELKSGVPLFDAMLGVSRDYGEVSVEFNKIVEKIALGVPATLAMHEVAMNNPSSAFRRVILQLANALVSGSDSAKALESVLEQITKEQIIKLKEYGQKLNPIVMFYMIFGIILPSLGVAFLIILISIVGGGRFQIGDTALLLIFALVTLIQYLFLSVVESSRPKFDLV